jgi:hypothetical protein
MAKGFFDRYFTRFIFWLFPGATEAQAADDLGERSGVATGLSYAVVYESMAPRLGGPGRSLDCEPNKA